MTALRESTADFAATQISGWLAAAAERIAIANNPGNLDGLFARHVLDGTTVTGLEWAVSPLSAQWLDDNRDRISQAPMVAALGYGLADSEPGDHSAAKAVLSVGLSRLRTRDPFQDRVTFVTSGRQILGIGLAVQAMAADLPGIVDWFRGILHDAQLKPAAKFQQLIYQRLRVILGDRPELVDWKQAVEAPVLALIHWMISTGAAVPPGSAAERLAFERQIISATLRTDPASLTIPEAAVIYEAVIAILDASIEHAVLRRSHLVTLLRAFEPAMRRWRWDDTDLKNPVRWPVTAEREVQDILWLILRPVFTDLVDEETLPKVGHGSYRADFGLPSLGVLIEAKYARTRSDFKKIEQEVMVDSIAYLHSTSVYKEIIVFIYDESASVQEHDVTAAALRKLNAISDVIIVSRPSQLA